MLQTSSQPTVKVGIINEGNTQASKKHLPAGYEALKASLIEKLRANMPIVTQSNEAAIADSKTNKKTRSK